MSQTAELFVDCRCRLGEGPLWNPLREQLFWFDILEKTLFAANTEGTLVNRWTFDRMPSVAGVVDFGVSPPQATRTADVPSAASVAARFESERFGRMLMFSLFTYF